MKFPAFDYVSPTSLDEVLAVLEERGGAAAVLAGGQSLLPILAFRLAAPEIVVDLRNVPGLAEIGIGGDGVRLGARVRWCDIERDARLATAHPLLLEATRHIAHYQIRNRGTVGGSLALADPASELPGVAVTCDGEIAITGSAGERVVKAGDFFLGPMSTGLGPGEIITGLRLPPWPPSRRWAFIEFSRRRGDFALAGIALYFDLDAKGRAIDTHMGVIGASDRPRRLNTAERIIDGNSIDAAVIEAAAMAASQAVEPLESHHAPADYLRALVATLLERSLLQASR